MTVSYLLRFACISDCQFVCNLFLTSVVTIGFHGTYSVREDTGVFSIVVLIMINSLARDVAVTLSTMDNTARGIGLQNA